MKIFSSKENQNIPKRSTWTKNNENVNMEMQEKKKEGEGFPRISEGRKYR